MRAVPCRAARKQGAGPAAGIQHGLCQHRAVDGPLTFPNSSLHTVNAEEPALRFSQGCAGSETHPWFPLARDQPSCSEFSVLKRGTRFHFSPPLPCHGLSPLPGSSRLGTLPEALPSTVTSPWHPGVRLKKACCDDLPGRENQQEALLSLGTGPSPGWPDHQGSCHSDPLWLPSRARSGPSR